MKNKLLMFSFISTLSIVGCNRNTTFKCLEDTSFLGINLDTSISNFDKSFTYGDSLKLEFSNGKFANDVPYYNGYYGKTDSLVVVSYPNNTYPGIHRCQGSSTYKEFEIKTDTTVKITINEKAKYLDIQNSLNLQYYTDISKYNNDEIRFSNFYSIEGSNIKKDLLYRSCSPINNRYNRALYACKQLKNNNIDYIINLSDSQEKYNQLKVQEGFMDRSKYYDDLVNDNNVYFANTGMNFKQDSYAQSLCDAINEFVIRYNTKGHDHVNKCHLHCEEGKDRTGFASFIIMALLNSSKEEIVNNYMKTYYNYYDINKTSDEKRYNTIVSLKVDDFIEYINELANKSNSTLQEGAIAYFKKGGLTQTEIDTIINTLKA